MYPTIDGTTTAYAKVTNAVCLVQRKYLWRFVNMSRVCQSHVVCRWFLALLDSSAMCMVLTSD